MRARDGRWNCDAMRGDSAPKCAGHWNLNARFQWPSAWLRERLTRPGATCSRDLGRLERYTMLLLQPHVFPFQHNLCGRCREERPRRSLDLVTHQVAASRPEERNVGLFLGQEKLLHLAQELLARVSIYFAALLV